MEIDDFNFFLTSFGEFLSSQVPEDEKDFKGLIKEIFKPVENINGESSREKIFNYIEHHKENSDLIQSKYPIYDDEYYKNWLKRLIRKFFAVYIFNDENHPKDVVDFSKYMLDYFDSVIYIHSDEPVREEVEPDIIYFEKQIKKYSELINTKTKEENLIFKIDAHKLQQILIAEKLILPSDNALSTFFSFNWNSNVPSINWEGKQQGSLLYLFFAINKFEREIPNGRITQLISKTFTHKKLVLEDEKLSKALYNIDRDYIIKGHNKPEFLLHIDRILYSVETNQ